MLGYPAETITTAGGCSNTVGANTIAAVRTYYDGSSILQTITGQGDPTSTISLKTSSPTAWTALSTATYDAYGRIKATSDPLGRTTATDYGTGTDSQYLPIAITTTNAKGWNTVTKLDPGRQLPLRTTDPNGNVTTLTYDGLGRLTQVWLPNHPAGTYPALPSQTIDYQVGRNTFVSTVTSTLHDGNLYSRDVKIYDALYQLRQDQSTPLDASIGTRLITSTYYDSHGWAIRSYNAVFNDDSGPITTPNNVIAENTIPDETRTAYDGRGRAVSSTLYSKGNPQWSTTTSYPGADLTTTTPPDGASATATVSDARGQQTELQQYQTNAPSGAYDATDYGYDAAGHQIKIVGPFPGGTSPTSSTPKWTWAYDALGDAVSTTDPDVGTTTNIYNDDAELTSSSTLGLETGDTAVTLAYQNDNLGRPRFLYSGSSAGPKISVWTYDTAGALGQLATATQYAADGTTITYQDTVTGYDALGKSTGDTISIPAGTYGNSTAITYTTKNTYTATSDLLDTQKLTVAGPGTGGLGSEPITYTYNLMGLPMASGGTDPYERTTSYDPWGRVLRGTSASQPHQAVVTNSWDATTGRLAETSVDKQDGTADVNDIKYTYNAAGAVTSNTDVRDSGGTANTDRQCFKYDYRQRLYTAWTDSAGVTTDPNLAGNIGGCTTTTPSSGTISGPAPYWQHFTYDLAGNRTLNKDYAFPGGPTSTTTYTDDYTGLPTAHTLHTVSTGSAVTTYTYNAGSTAKSTTKVNNVTDASQTRTYTWTLTHRLASLKIGTNTATTYTYDPDGNLVGRTNGTASTLYLGADTLILSSGSISKDVRNYEFPGALTALRAKSGATVHLYFQANDVQGTATTNIDAATLDVDRQSYTPFGKPRTTTNPGAWPHNDDKTFLNAPTDTTTGLTTLGARQYDPALGRFLSVDPLLDGGDPQSLEGYAYADNDPTNSSDPSGLRPIGDSGSDTSAGCWGTGTCSSAQAVGPTLYYDQVVYAAIAPKVTSAQSTVAKTTRKLSTQEYDLTGQLAYGFFLAAVSFSSKGGSCFSERAPAACYGGGSLEDTLSDFGLTRINGEYGRTIIADSPAYLDLQAETQTLDAIEGKAEAAEARVEADLNASKAPNPYGRRGSPAHVSRIGEAEQRLADRGWETESGGTLPEQKYGSRFPDLVMSRGDRTIAIQVGRATKGGLPVARERRAISDLQQTGAFDHVFFLKYN